MPDYNSVGCVVSKIVQLELNDLRCNINSVYNILTRLALVKTHSTSTDDGDSDLGNAVTYQCFVWCVSSEGTPIAL
jgi:hypothetical protein